MVANEASHHSMRYTSGKACLIDMSGGLQRSERKRKDRNKDLGRTHSHENAIDSLQGQDQKVDDHGRCPLHQLATKKKDDVPPK